MRSKSQFRIITPIEDTAGGEADESGRFLTNAICKTNRFRSQLNTILKLPYTIAFSCRILFEKESIKLYFGLYEE
jgi:hypothetical protein